MLEKIIYRIFIKGNVKGKDISVAKLKMDFYKVYVIMVLLVSAIVATPATALVVIFIEYKKLIALIVMILYIIIFNLFKMRISFYTIKLSYFIYGHIYPLKGKAISKNEFKLIKKDAYYTYYAIVYNICVEHCYSICFNLIKALKKGEMKYIAIKNTSEDNKESNYCYTMHVLYVNNGWCYDTFSNKQYLLNGLMNVFEAKEYRTYSYEDIKSKTYDEFIKEALEDARNWGKCNDCYVCD